MRHQRHVAHFGRKSGPRKALLRGLVVSLVEHGRIRTTVAKAKELRRHVERAITKGKEASLHARRLLLARYPNKATVDKIIHDIGPRFKDRNGGYTRIIKLGNRPGDNADMAFIEFVDYQLGDKGKTKETAKPAKVSESTEVAAEASAEQKPQKKVAKKKAPAKKKTAAKSPAKKKSTAKKKKAAK